VLENKKGKNIEIKDMFTYIYIYKARYGQTRDEGDAVMQRTL